MELVETQKHTSPAKNSLKIEIKISEKLYEQGTVVAQGYATEVLRRNRDAICSLAGNPK